MGDEEPLIHDYTWYGANSCGTIWSLLRVKVTSGIRMDLSYEKLVVNLRKT